MPGYTLILHFSGICLHLDAQLLVVRTVNENGRKDNDEQQSKFAEKSMPNVFLCRNAHPVDFCELERSFLRKQARCIRNYD
jgi:hypothetical protein